LDSEWPVEVAFTIAAPDVEENLKVQLPPSSSTFPTAPDTDTDAPPASTPAKTMYGEALRELSTGLLEGGADGIGRGELPSITTCGFSVHPAITRHKKSKAIKPPRPLTKIKLNHPSRRVNPLFATRAFMVDRSVRSI